MLNIISVPDPVLRQKSKPIPDLDSSTITFIEDLIQTLLHKTDPPGVGISAIQVGLPKRLFLTLLPRDPSLPSKDWSPETLEVKVYLNPTFKKLSPKKTLGGKKDKPFLEGCLSIPHLYGPVSRHEWVELNFQTLRLDSDNKVIKNTLNEETKRFKSFFARVIQHEMDHLEGVLFTDHSLKEGHQLFLDDGKELVPLSDPSAIIKW